MKQQTFSDIEYANRKRKTKREIFLDAMDGILEWKKLEQIIAPYYFNNKRGRPPMGIEKMLRMYFLQVWFNLSDEGLEDSIYDSYGMRKFMGLNFLEEQVPDATTLLKFRRIIEKDKLGQKIFEMVQDELEKAGRIMHGGTIVDATLIEAPVSTKNKTHSRDPEMHQTKKGNQWHHGGKAHIGVDAGTGLVHSLEFTAANVHDVTQTHKLIREDDEVVHGDSGYTGIEKREEITGDEHLNEVEFRIAQRRGKVEDMEKIEYRWLDRRDEYLNAKVRSKVEFAFQLLKCKFGYRKVAYRGLEKNLNRLYMIFSSVNLYMMIRSGGMNRSMMSRSSLA